MTSILLMFATTVSSSAKRAESRFILLAFFLSGWAAIAYQLVWQRLLFSLIGVDHESVTIIVTAFLLGLGCGGLVGGYVAKRTRRGELLFSLLEIGIGLFALISLPLFRAVGDALVHHGRSVSAVGVFLLLLFPTTLMGSTLPILSEVFAQKGTRREAIANLYTVNTLGSAVGCLVLVMAGFSFLGLSGSVYLAATLNFLVAGLILFTSRQQ